MRMAIETVGPALQSDGTPRRSVCFAWDGLLQLAACLTRPARRRGPVNIGNPDDELTHRRARAALRGGGRTPARARDDRATGQRAGALRAAPRHRTRPGPRAYAVAAADAAGRRSVAAARLGAVEPSRCLSSRSRRRAGSPASRWRRRRCCSICRIARSRAYTRSPPADSLEMRSPLRVVQAPVSGLVQLAHRFESSVYSDYGFAGDTSQAYRAHLEWFAGELHAGLEPGGGVLEVGCGDGTLLGLLRERGHGDVIGIDPGRAAAASGDPRRDRRVLPRRSPGGRARAALPPRDRSPRARAHRDPAHVHRRARRLPGRGRRAVDRGAGPRRDARRRPLEQLLPAALQLLHRRHARPARGDGRTALRRRHGRGRVRRLAAAALPARIAEMVPARAAPAGARRTRICLVPGPPGRARRQAAGAIRRLRRGRAHRAHARGLPAAGRAADRVARRQRAAPRQASGRDGASRSAHPRISTKPPPRPWCCLRSRIARRSCGSGTAGSTRARWSRSPRAIAAWRRSGSLVARAAQRTLSAGTRDTSPPFA